MDTDKKITTEGTEPAEKRLKTPARLWRELPSTVGQAQNRRTTRRQLKREGRSSRLARCIAAWLTLATNAHG